MCKLNIKIGQQLYLEPKGNLKNNRERHIYPYQIVSIGKKYFYVAHNLKTPKKSWIKIDKTTLETKLNDCNSYYKVWLTTNDFEKDLTYQTHLAIIKNYFSSVPYSPFYNDLSKEHCEQIYDILCKNNYLQKK